MTDGQVLYWAHHEKLCLVDGHIAFMGGLDLCYGRWDTHQHSIADAHPGDLDQIIFPGQDYNNARIMDFQNVFNYASNGLSILDSARMPWHDVSLAPYNNTVINVPISGAYDLDWSSRARYRAAFCRKVERNQETQGLPFFYNLPIRVANSSLPVSQRRVG